MNSLRKENHHARLNSLLDEAERTTRTAFMRDGAIIEFGTPKDLKATVNGIILEVVPSDVRTAKAALKRAGRDP